jgi:hypothetical protein
MNTVDGILVWTRVIDCEIESCCGIGQAVEIRQQKYTHKPMVGALHLNLFIL